MVGPPPWQAVVSSRDPRGREKAAHVREHRCAPIHGEVVDVVVKRGEVEVPAGRSLQDVALLDPHPVRQTPGMDVVAGLRHHVRREVDAQRGELRVALRGRTEVDRAPAADLEETDRPAGRHDVLDRIADERLQGPGGACDQIAAQVVEGERARLRRRCGPSVTQR